MTGAVYAREWTDLVFGALCVQHGKQHFSVPVAFGLVGLQDLTESWGWGLANERGQKRIWKCP